MKRPKSDALDWDLLVCPPYVCWRSMIYDLYVVQEMGMQTIGDIIGVNKKTVRDRIVELGILIRRKGYHRRNAFKRKAINPYKDKLYELYVLKGYGLRGTARELNVSMMTIKRHLQKYGFPIRPAGKHRKQSLNTEIEQTIQQLEFNAECNVRDSEDYFPPDARINENRRCLNYNTCLTYCAIINNLIIPCTSCNGTPDNMQEMQEANQDFDSRDPKLDEKQAKRLAMLEQRASGNYRKQVQIRESQFKFTDESSCKEFLKNKDTSKIFLRFGQYRKGSLLFD